MELLCVRGLKVGIDGREILHGVDLEVGAGETVVLLGANGAGKSTLAGAVMGTIGGVPTEVGGESGDEMAKINGGGVKLMGEIKFNGDEITTLKMDERARKGIFCSSQAPVEIPGVTMVEMLRTALEERAGRGLPRQEIEKKIADGVRALKMDAFTAGREVNMGASGGERRKNEVLQMLVLEPKLAILDEIDSGLDVDAAKVVSEVIAKWQEKTGAGLLIITHNMRVLESLTVSRVYVMESGRIVESGGRELLEKVEKGGFQRK